MVHTIHRFCIIPKIHQHKYFVHTTDNPLWTAGKTLMPTITLEEFDRRVSAEKGAIIIVPNKYSKEFTNSPTNIIATEVGKNGSSRIYQIH